MSVSHHIGLEVGEFCFRLIELQRQDHHTVVLRADVYETAVDFTSPRIFDLPFDRELAKIFIGDLIKVLSAGGLFSSSVSIVLPADLPLTATFPLDMSLPEQDRMAFLEWECRTLMGYSENTPMSVLSHTIRHEGIHPSALVVALPQSFVTFMHSVFSHLTFQLAVIDIDHFIMENFVRKHYPRFTAEGLAVLGMFESHCCAGVYHGPAYYGFRLSTVSYRSQYSSQVLRLLENISHRQLDNVYCFGPNFTRHVADTLQTALNTTVSRCIPLTDPADVEVLRKSGMNIEDYVFDIAAAAAILGLR